MNATSSKTPGQNRRLCEAREFGYLDARRPDSDPLVKAYGLWCWRMKLPLVRFERRSRWSRFGRLHVELMTTPEVLTPLMQARLEELGATVSPHDAHWDRVPLADLPALARLVFRELRRPPKRSRPCLTVMPKVAAA